MIRCPICGEEFKAASKEEQSLYFFEHTFWCHWGFIEYLNGVDVHPEIRACDELLLRMEEEEELEEHLTLYALQKLNP